MAKAGRPESKQFSSKAKQFIEENKSSIPVEDIAKQLNVEPDRVVKYLQKSNSVSIEKIKEDNKPNFRKKLVNSYAWKQIKKQFSDDELGFFQERYISLMGQFEDDVLPTEEEQIFQAITLEILRNRGLVEKQESREYIAQLEAQQKEILRAYHDDLQSMPKEMRELLNSISQNIGIARSSEQTRSNEIIKLQENHAKIMQSLKGTRDQRVDQFKSSKTTFVDLVKFLQQRDFQESEGRQLELTKLATDKEWARLASINTYLDDNRDRPLLNADTVDLEPDKFDNYELKETEEEE